MVLGCGGAAKKRIAGDHILLGDIMVFTKQNIEQYDF
jgi:hypothetical protein